MPPARVLIVDDSVVVRKMLSDIVSSDPELELGGTAATAAIGLQKIPQLAPDVVVLDVEMPGMDGIEAARRIRAEWPKLPIVMCSSLTERGADVTLQALAAGASDYVAKPSSLGGRDAALSSFREELLAKLHALAGRYTRYPPPMAPPAPRPPARPAAPQPVSVLAIGSSTGGPTALAEVFKDLPPDLGVPILLIQHMPPLFTRMLADRLTATSRVRVTEAVDGEELLPSRAYIAPGNFHVGLVREGTKVKIALNQEAPENSCRPAVDVTFRAVAQLYGPGVLAAVLTGMGHDGTRGAAEIVERGGMVVVQDSESCVVPSMPRSVAAAGLAAATYPLSRLGHELVAQIKRRAMPQTWARSAP